MHRLMASLEDAERGGRLELPAEAAAHLKVLRPKDGEELELFDGRGGTLRCRWHAGAGRLEPQGCVRRIERPAGPRLVLFACITKGSRWDWTVSKAVELGTDRIVPVVSERTIVRIGEDEKEAKRERWLRIAEDAARQSGAAWMPQIDAATGFGEAVKLAAQTRCFAGIISDPPPPPLLAAIKNAPADGRDYSLFTGPEGDFTPGERAALTAAAAPCSFGPTILRAETAAIFGLSVLAAARAVR